MSCCLVADVDKWSAVNGKQESIGLAGWCRHATRASVAGLLLDAVGVVGGERMDERPDSVLASACAESQRTCGGVVDEDIAEPSERHARGKEEGAAL